MLADLFVKGLEDTAPEMPQATALMDVDSQIRASAGIVAALASSVSENSKRVDAIQLGPPAIRDGSRGTPATGNASAINRSAVIAGALTPPGRKRSMALPAPPPPRPPGAAGRIDTTSKTGWCCPAPATATIIASTIAIRAPAHMCY